MISSSSNPFLERVSLVERIKRFSFLQVVMIGRNVNVVVSQTTILFSAYPDILNTRFVINDNLENILFVISLCS